MQTEFDISTRGPGLYEFTDEVARWIGGTADDGLLTLMIRHTSASLLVMENADADVRSDMTAFFDRLVPPSDHPSMRYLRHTYEGPDDMPAHIKSALMPVSVSIPVRQGGMRLGTWQGLYVVEHRSSAHLRHVAAHFQRDAG